MRGNQNCMNPGNAASLRPATEEDMDAILAIENASYPKPWGRAQFEHEWSLPYSRFLALTDDETDSLVIGYLVYHLQAEAVSLLNLSVSPEFRGLGFGRMILSAMIREAVREEIPRTLLEVRASNGGAIRLYEKAGFKKTHERKGFYSDGETAWVMELKTSDITTPLQ